MLARISSKLRSFEHAPIAFLLIALVFGFVLRLLLLPSVGNVRDMTAFRLWMFTLQSGSLADFYTNAGFIDYTPGYLFVLKGVGMLYTALHVHDSKALWLDALLKLPPVLADLGCGVLVYVIALRFAQPARALTVAACVLFNPALIILSAGWGQVDSVPAAFMLGALLFFIEGSRRKHAGSIAAAWVLVTIAALMKPAIYIVIPLLLLAAFAAPDRAGRRARFAGTLSGIALGCVLAYAAIFAFHRDLNPLHDALWLVQRYAYSSGVYAMTSVNAFNLWAVGQSFWLPDSVRPFAGVPLSEAAIGIALVVLAAVLVLGVYWRKRSDEALIVAATLLSLAFFLFPTRMHERYMFNAVVLAQLCSIFGVVYARAAGVLSLTFACNLVYALYYAYAADHAVIGIDSADIVPFLTRPLALANLCVFMIVLVLWARAGERPQRVEVLA